MRSTARDPATHRRAAVRRVGAGDAGRLSLAGGGPPSRLGAFGIRLDAAANAAYLERVVKFLLWSRGGYRIHLDGPAELLRERVAQRTDHYMPASLVESQLDTLEPLRPDEDGVVLEASRSLDDLVDAIIRSLDLPDSRDFTSVR